jgi:hypothetical protein
VESSCDYGEAASTTVLHYAVAVLYKQALQAIPMRRNSRPMAVWRQNGTFVFADTMPSIAVFVLWAEQATAYRSAFRLVTSVLKGGRQCLAKNWRYTVGSTVFDWKTDRSSAFILLAGCGGCLFYKLSSAAAGLGNRACSGEEMFS